MKKVFASQNPEFPRVEITEKAMNAVNGEVYVDLDGINELLREDLGLKKTITPKYLLYGNDRGVPLLGLHIPYSHKAYVQLPASTRMYGSAVRTLIHESVHLVDSVEHRVRTGAELALRGLAGLACARISKEVGENLPGPTVTDALGQIATFVGLRTNLYYRHLDPSENRARRFQTDDDLFDKYRDVIKIGYSRTAYPTL